MSMTIIIVDLMSISISSLGQGDTLPGIFSERETATLAPALLARDVSFEASECLPLRPSGGRLACLDSENSRRRPEQSSAQE